MSELLNYKLEGEGHTIVLIHGLFGNLDNLGVLARDLKADHQVLSVDLRNHGISFHSDEHNYQLMADDVVRLLAHLQISDFTLVGHSMGGKVAIKVAETLKQQVRKLIVLDMAPVHYTTRRHDNVISGLVAVSEQNPSSRSQALDILAQHIEIDGVRQFLSKSLYKQDDIMQWRFNVKSIVENYESILGWEAIEPIDTPTLFVKGADSDYLLPEHQADVQKQMSQSKAHIIANTGHWLHAEKPKEVLRVIRNFIA
ncbi:alpha/beta fold hydrolase [Vibrio sp. SCSIO 43135]|uniref:Alpha/beta fold hydrolase n=1 Tax=Vibrio paucivorans TaxID=2829489 RepID=A0A9X3CBN5_9VIBR|nr:MULTISPECIES: alpha/beta fold hydrolase [Vibrio]MCW8332747.1 alpha/beta fold hydrolase [Vibrio paucivorans]USD41889.1 alpha/beta fold hydrolase [Vibrio sp. SCSIO 43135]